MSITDKIEPSPEFKKEAPVYQNLSSSKQTFDEIRFFDAINGNIVLRGKQGRRDKVYPLPAFCQRFIRWFEIWLNWQKLGFNTQCQELRLVLDEMAGKIQQATSQRMTGKWDSIGQFKDQKKRGLPPANFILWLEQARKKLAGRILV